MLRKHVASFSIETAMRLKLGFQAIQIYGLRIGRAARRDREYKIWGIAYMHCSGKSIRQKCGMRSRLIDV